MHYKPGECGGSSAPPSSGSPGCAPDANSMTTTQIDKEFFEEARGVASATDGGEGTAGEMGTERRKVHSEHEDEEMRESTSIALSSLSLNPPSIRNTLK